MNRSETISEKSSRSEIILEGQKRALELAVNGNSLGDVLDVLTYVLNASLTIKFSHLSF